MTNVIDGFRHAVTCPFVLDRSQMCDCNPLDETRAMRGEDVQRIFSPLPPGEARQLSRFWTGPECGPGMLNESEEATLAQLARQYSIGSILDALASIAFRNGNAEVGQRIQRLAKDIE